MLQKDMPPKDFVSLIGDMADLAMSALNYGQGALLPGLHPLVGASLDTVSYTATGGVYDFFRGRDIITAQQKAIGKGVGLPPLLGGEHGGSFWPFMGYQWNQLGGGAIWRYYDNADRPRDKSLMQTVLELPLVSTTAGRFIKVTNYGDYEWARSLTESSEKQRALRQLSESRVVGEIVQKQWADIPREKRYTVRLPVMARDALERLYPTRNFVNAAPRSWTDEEREIFAQSRARGPQVRRLVNLEAARVDNQTTAVYLLSSRPTVEGRNDLLTALASEVKTDLGWYRKVQKIVEYGALKPDQLPTPLWERWYRGYTQSGDRRR